MYGAAYQSVLLHTPSAEGLLVLAPHIFGAFRDITKKSPRHFAMPAPETGRSRWAAGSPASRPAGPPGTRAVADLWGGLRQAHQSLPLWCASNGSQLQAMWLQLGDSGEEGRCWQGGSREVRSATALLLVPTEVEGHLLPYR